LDRNKSARSVPSVCSCYPNLILVSRLLVFEQEVTERTEHWVSDPPPPCSVATWLPAPGGRGQDHG